MPRSSKKSVGVIGLGIIGSRVASLLRKAGYEVYVWNRSPKRETNFVGSPLEVAKLCPVLQLFVPDDASLLETVEKIKPALSSRHVVLAHPTVLPATMIAAAAAVEKTGAKFLEAPFTGSKNAAKNGELSYYVGGELAALEGVRPVLQASAKAILPMGRVGDASVIKLATNMISASIVQTLAEALALVEGSRVSPNKLVEALEHNASRSATTDMKLPLMIAEDYEAHFSLRHMFKDLAHALKVADEIDIDLPTTRMTSAVLHEGMRAGWGDFDFSVIARHYFPERAKPPEEPQPEAIAAEKSPEIAGIDTPPEIKAEAPHETSAPKPEAKSEKQAAGVTPEEMPVLNAEDIELLPSRPKGEPTSDLVSLATAPKAGAVEILEAKVAVPDALEERKPDLAKKTPEPELKTNPSAKKSEAPKKPSSNKPSLSLAAIRLLEEKKKAEEKSGEGAAGVEKGEPLPEPEESNAGETGPESEAKADETPVKDKKASPVQRFKKWLGGSHKSPNDTPNDP